MGRLLYEAMYADAPKEVRSFLGVACNPQAIMAQLRAVETLGLRFSWAHIEAGDEKFARLTHSYLAKEGYASNEPSPEIAGVVLLKPGVLYPVELEHVVHARSKSAFAGQVSRLERLYTLQQRYVSAAGEATAIVAGIVVVQR